MVIDIVVLIQILVISQCLLLGGFLWITKRAQAHANRWLAAFLWVLPLHMLFNILVESGLLPVDPTPGYPFLYGPLFFLYVRSRVFAATEERRLLWPHFVAAPMGALLYMLGLVPIPILGALAFTGLFLYWGMSFLMVGTYQRVVKMTQSLGDEISLRWVQHFMIAFVILVFFELVRFLFEAAGSPIPGGYLAGMIAVWFLITGMVWKALRYPMLFDGVTDGDLEMVVTPTAPNSEGIEEEDEEEDERLLGMIESVMISDQLYLQPNLSLDEVADHIQLPVKTVSRLINAGTGQNFSDWVNSHRVRHAQNLLDDRARNSETILHILHESGFNAKSSFNLAFKRHAGMTPTQWRKRLR